MTPKEKHAAYQRKWRAENKEKAQASVLKWRRANPEKQAVISRRANMSHRYGITTEQRDERFEAQGSCCAICSTTEPGTKAGWHVDHNHTTGDVRGILCHGCNVGLGCFKEDPDAIQRAIDYLERFNASTSIRH